MKIHREGYTIILIALLILSAIQAGNYFLYTYTDWLWLFLLLSTGVLVMFYLVVQFFRIPKREVSFEANELPASL